MIARRKRGERRCPNGRLRVQERDRAVLHFTGRAGVVELKLIASLFWHGTSGALAAAGRRFRVYADHGLVSTWVRELSLPNRYTLTEKGASWVGSSNDDGRVLRTRVRADSESADHLVASAKVWASVATRLSRAGAPRLERYVTEGEIRRGLRVRRGALIPDGVAIVGSKPGVALALEVDLHNERPEIFATKLQKYRRRRGDGRLMGVTFGALLIIAPGRSRLARLAIEVRRAGLDDATFFQDLARIGSATLLDSVATVSSLAAAARSGSDPFTHSLMETPSCT